MSQFIGTSNGFAGINLLPVDEQVMHKSHKWDGRADQVQIVPWQPGVLWSSSGFCGNAGGGTFGLFADDLAGPHSKWDEDLRYTGGQTAKKLIGTTRDSAGAALGNCVVEGFVTSTDVSIGKVTSDTAGYYELPSSAGAVNHYIVAYKSGSPDVAGTSKNNLVPV